MARNQALFQKGVSPVCFLRYGTEEQCRKVLFQRCLPYGLCLSGT